MAAVDDPNVLRGLATFVDDYLSLGSGEPVLVCFWHDCLIGASLLVMELEVRHHPVLCHRFSHRSDSQFEHDLQGLVGEAVRRHGRATVVVGEPATLSFTHPLRRILKAFPEVRIWRLMNFSDDLFRLATTSTRGDLKNINAGLLTRFMRTDELHITSDAGTDLIARLDHDQFEWVSNHGTPGPGELMVLPAGEVNTYPASLSGQFVADGALHSNIRLPIDVRLTNPLTVYIRDNIVTGVSSKKSVQRDVLDVVLEQAYGDHVGELGFGTNVGIFDLVSYNSHINERVPGIHLGLGEHTQPKSVAYTADVHLDLIARGGYVDTQDGRPLVDLSDLAPKPLEHPFGTRSEDIEHVPR